MHLDFLQEQKKIYFINKLNGNSEPEVAIGQLIKMNSSKTKEELPNKRRLSHKIKKMTKQIKESSFDRLQNMPLSCQECSDAI